VVIDTLGVNALYYAPEEAQMEGGALKDGLKYADKLK
jgi:hypothetical protein